MSISILLHTLYHLKPQQVYYQMIYRLRKPLYVAIETPKFEIPRLKTTSIAKPQCLVGEFFTFLNLSHEFAGWGFKELGNLWTYNQNYFDWLEQDSMTEAEGCKWIDKFEKDVLRIEFYQESFPRSANSPFSFDPYPIALRSINWAKFFCRYPECATKQRVDSLYSQVKLLEKKLEYHLLGNHLLEDAYALFISGSFFKDTLLLQKAERLLTSQLEEQILKDGAHYEQSPMYHCILLDRLLDCINFSLNIDDSDLIDRLKGYAERMLGHLESIVWKNRTIPLLNDSAYGIAPTPNQIFDYAERLGLVWKAIPMKESGYRKMAKGQYEAIVDVGSITATYQPGHTHADALNYELRIDGKPVVVDCGISTYNKTERRLYERGTSAHNCVVVNGRNSSEVWGGFRVGKRCRVKVESVEFKDDRMSIVENITATHDGYKKPCKRKFEVKGDGFCVEDWYDGEAVSYVHLAEGTDEKRIRVENAVSVEIKPWQYSEEYNRFKEGKEVEIRFWGYCRYIIK